MAHRRSLTMTTTTGVLLLAALALTAAADEVYVGTVAVSTGAQATPTPLSLTVRAYTADERVMALADLLHRSGHPAAVAEMAKDQAGTVQLGDATFKAAVIRQEQTPQGRLLRVVTDRPLQAAAAGAKPLPADAVGYLELRLGPAGANSGRLLPAITIVFDAEGFLSPQSLGPEWPVSGGKPGQ
jgi:hypothetical protein